MSVRENEYSRQIKRKADDELLEILHNYEAYREDLLQAVIWEAEDRQLPVNLPQSALDAIALYHAEQEKEKARAKAEAERVAMLERKEEIAPATPETGEKLFSQSAILGFSLFFSPISAGILLAMNMKRLQRKGIIQVIVFAIVFTLFQGYVSMRLQQGSIITLLINVAGALIMSELMWKQFIGKRIPYQRRSIIIPLLIAIAIVAPLVWYVYQHPEFLETTQP